MKVFIDRIAYEKINYWIHKTTKEISGLGIVEVIDGNAHINDVILLKQENSASETEINPEDIGKAMFEFHTAGKKGDIRFWWHSHVDMNVFWSNTDYECMELISKQGWFISTVFNKKGENKTAFSDNSIQELNKSGLSINYEIFSDDLDLIIDNGISKDLIGEWDKQFIEKVSEKQIISTINRLPDSYLNDLDDYYDEYEAKKYSFIDESKYLYYEFFCNNCNHQFDGDICTEICPKCKSDHIAELDDDIPGVDNFRWSNK